MPHEVRLRRGEKQDDKKHHERQKFFHLPNF